MSSTFTYTIFVRATASEAWDTFLLPELSCKYWYESVKESTWQPGAPWVMKTVGDLVTDSGVVNEVELHKKLVFTWRCEFLEDLKSEGFADTTVLFEEQGEMVKLTVIQSMNIPNSKLISSVSNGWPIILSSMKSMMETGHPLPATMYWN